jgi:type 1 glutamine amidotransferase
MTMTRSISEGTGKTALVVRGGWEGHSPIETSDWYADALKEAGYEVTVFASLDCYLDAELLQGTDLIVQCWTMGRITADQLAAGDLPLRARGEIAGFPDGVR